MEIMERFKKARDIIENGCLWCEECIKKIGDENLGAARHDKRKKE